MQETNQADREVTNNNYTSSPDYTIPTTLLGAFIGLGVGFYIQPSQIYAIITISGSIGWVIGAVLTVFRS